MPAKRAHQPQPRRALRAPGPQDEPTARAVGSKTYNELVVQLVTSLGSGATPTPKQLTPSASLHRGQHPGSCGLTPHASGAVGSAASGPLPAISEHGGEHGALQQARQQGQYVDAEALSAALQNSLLISREAAQAQAGGAAGGACDAEPGSSGPASARSWAGRSGSLGPADASRAASSLSSLQASDSMKSMVNRMLTDLVSVSGARPPGPAAGRRATREGRGWGIKSRRIGAASRPATVLGLVALECFCKGWWCLPGLFRAGSWGVEPGLPLPVVLLPGGSPGTLKLCLLCLLVCRMLSPLAHPWPAAALGTLPP